MPSRRLERIARNEVSFRTINEELEEGLRRVERPPELLRFVCECGRQECDLTVELRFEEYEAVRRDSRHFAVAPGHALPEAEVRPRAVGDGDVAGHDDRHLLVVEVDGVGEEHVGSEHAELVEVHERSMARPWSLGESDLFIARLLNQIVGLRIEIERIEGKWKLSQNHPVERREKVIQALAGRGDKNSAAVAALMVQQLDREAVP